MRLRGTFHSDILVRYHGNPGVNKSDAVILAARITGYGIYTPPEPGPSLEVYDQAFLPVKDDGKEAAAS